jgi:hypothetical protein
MREKSVAAPGEVSRTRHVRTATQRDPDGIYAGFEFAGDVSDEHHLAVLFKESRVNVASSRRRKKTCSCGGHARCVQAPRELGLARTATHRVTARLIFTTRKINTPLECC